VALPVNRGRPISVWPWVLNRQIDAGSGTVLKGVIDGLKTDELRRFENHCPQKLNGRSGTSGFALPSIQPPGSVFVE
jgi:hypothetical protein